MRGPLLRPLSEFQPPTGDIIGLLTEFATASRYHNLDSVGGGAKTVDPLVRWNSILVCVIENDLPATRRKKIKDNARLGDDLLAGKLKVRMSSLDGKELTSFEALMHPVLHQSAAPYIIRYIIRFLTPIRDFTRHINLRAFEAQVHLPSIHEFIAWLPHEGADVLRKKRWP